MKLLFDHHLSFRLADRFADLFPGSSHVLAHHLDHAQDTEIWEFARINGFTIVTKDADFNDLSALLGFPPKIIWIRLGNCKTQEIEALLISHSVSILDLDNDTEIGILEIS